jgi:hypothetical protein
VGAPPLPREAGVIYHQPGEPLPKVTFGDVILTHSTFWTGKLIRFGQALRWRGTRRKYAYWNHAMLCTDGATVVEALGHGVQESPLAKYADTEFVLIPIEINNLDAEQMRRFVRQVLYAKTDYGYLELISLGLTLAIPLPIQFGSPGTMICSGFVAATLTRMGAIWKVSPEYIMPADIAELFDAGAPE